MLKVHQMSMEEKDALTSIPILGKEYVEEPNARIIDEEKDDDVWLKEEDGEYSPKRFSKWTFNGAVRKIITPVCVYAHKILEEDLLQVTSVMGLEDKIDVTNDIGLADAILVSSSEIKQNPWIRGVAKFHQLPIYVITSTTMAQMVKAVRMILGVESFGFQSKLPQENSFDIEI